MCFKKLDHLGPGVPAGGGVQDVRLYYAVGNAIANSDAWPSWNEGTEFRAIREKSLSGG